MMFWTGAMIMLFCENGHLVTKQFEKFSYELDQRNWYLYSIEMQRMFVFFMSNAHQHVHIRGYGHILCSRNKVKEVKKLDFLFFKY